jgi:hypothetical protein
MGLSMLTSRQFLIVSVLLMPIVALRPMTRDLAISSPASFGCASASKRTAGVGAFVGEIVSSTDTGTAGLRTAIGLPQMATTAVKIDAASSHCNRALTAYQAARGFPAAQGQLSLWQLGNFTYYAAYDPYGVPGTRSVVFFRSDWTLLGMLPVDY